MNEKIETKTFLKFVKVLVYFKYNSFFPQKMIAPLLILFSILTTNLGIV
jgi:hypothetical protein